MEDTEERQPPDVMTSDTNNATKVEPKDAPPHKKAKFKRFRAYNRGTWNGPKRENKEVIRRQDDLHRFDSIASALNLNDRQKSQGRKMLDTIEVTKKKIGIDVIIFGICAIVANEDVRDGSRYYPHPEATGDRHFEKVADSLDLDRHDQISAIEKVRSRANL
jgi:hypothetical protein